MGKPAWVFLSAALLLLLDCEVGVAVNLLPYGNGDAISPLSDDGGPGLISLQNPIKYFGRTYNQIYLNNNGLLTFTQSLSAYVPYQNSGLDLIAPLWTDLNNEYGGTIYYREDTSSGVLALATQAVNQYFPHVPFTAASVFVATWDSVPYYGGHGMATFQVVVASNGVYSFVLNNYGSIEATAQPWLAGYQTEDSVSSFTIPGNNPTALLSSSNVNVIGSWSFHVDGSPDYPVNFLPYGNGDAISPLSDDGGPGLISLQNPIKYFGRTYNQIYLNNNGLLTFTQSLSAYVPYQNSGLDLIAPLWTDLNNEYGGTIYYREDTSSGVLALATQAVNQYFPHVPFTAASVFVATWDSVPYYGGHGMATFQVVVASNGVYSFVLNNYGSIEATAQPWLAGYQTEDSVSSFTIPGNNPTALLSSSNVNVIGRWSFHVDGSPDYPVNFLPYGNGDAISPLSDDGGPGLISLQNPIKYFGRTYNQIYLNNNGLLTFTQSLSAYVPYQNSGLDLIAPLWTDLNNEYGGTIYYREDTSSGVLALATQAVNQYFPHVPFTAASVFVATWDSVPYYGGHGMATFQVVVASNGVYSFVLNNYGSIEATAQPWLAGYQTEDSVSSFTIPGNNPTALLSSSNVNVIGRWSFHVDGSPDYPVNFLPYGNGDAISPLSDDGGPGLISLQNPIKYFGRTYNQIYLNNNGLLTFTQSLSAYVPYQNSGLDLIAPLWTDLNNEYGGTIYYREDTSSGVLALATQAVNQYFPHVPFTAASVFVATWDSVPYYGGHGMATFQVVVASNGVYSFVLNNYGSIEATAQPWLAGYQTEDSVSSFTIPGNNPTALLSSSNVNVIGRWSFHVDGSPDYPVNFLPYGNGDAISPLSDDGGPGLISLQNPIKYFGRTYNQIYLNNNGLLTFTQSLSAYVPYQNSGLDLIAPLWTDLNNEYGGTIYYREDTSSGVLALATQAVNQYFPHVPFTAASVFVATWERVPYYGGHGMATFQVVVASNGVYSFVLNNYGSIEATAQPWLAGYQTEDSVSSFTIPGNNPTALLSSSNVNVIGRWSFHVDGSPDYPVNFLPYGNGDAISPLSDDGGPGLISLQNPIKYFGRTYNQIYLNNNGLLTFTQSLSAYVPYQNSGLDLIAPLWTDLNNEYGGTIYYREDTSSGVLALATQAVNQYFPHVPFTAASVFVATWERVPYYGGYGMATFQVVLACSSDRTIILYNYGDIRATAQPWLADYDTEDSVSSFTIPVANPPALSSSSNFNVNGRWSFHVDGSTDYPFHFLPYGNGDAISPISDDGGPGLISLQNPIKYFGRTYNQIYLNNNGLLTFTQSLSAYVPYQNSGLDLIAPLWTDLNNEYGGTIYYREDTSSGVLALATQAVNQNFPHVPFTAASVFVATWERVPYYGGYGMATFQVVLVSSSDRSYILLNYGDIDETGQIWLAGYDTEDSISSFMIPASSPSALSSTSNFNVNGCWSFFVNMPVNFLPYGNQDAVNPIADDGSSDSILLQNPITYFGRTYGDIYVNNNGFLTFTQSLSAYVPYLNSGLDLIAPLWTDLNNEYGGTIYYREDTSSGVLALATQAVNQYFPHVPFTTASVFVATWDSVPYYGGHGIATFQVVVVCSGDLSFVLMNYGIIAGTSQTWLAGYDTEDSVSFFRIPASGPSALSSTSNFHVNGRWSFHVDGSTDFCDSLACTQNEVCQEISGVYGCTCLDGQTLIPRTFDPVEQCANSTGLMSLSRCQIFDAGFDPEILHLNDPICTGTVQDGRVLFYFDNQENLCGTTLTSNGTHFIYQNTIQSNLRSRPQSIISRGTWMNISFSCAYPLIQTLSMPMGFRAESIVLIEDLPAGQGQYQIRMVPYQDAQFTTPYTGEVQMDVNQLIYASVEVNGVDQSQIATVLDNCWATPVNDANYPVRWSLITRECPNPEDGTVQVLQNGVSTASHFSFRMFTFTGISDHIYLHCQVHLCLLQNGNCAQSCSPGYRRRRRRSRDFHHSTSISMSF